VFATLGESLNVVDDRPQVVKKRGNIAPPVGVKVGQRCLVSLCFDEDLQ
jgi:hypothetical protein